ncbi:unnamed protein product, partial [Cladocopium goreaui]
ALEPTGLQAIGAARRPGTECSTVSFVGSKGYTFGINKVDEHNGLLTAEKDKAYRISTDGSYHKGHWNTVLGDQEIPQSGRSYWEVKFVKKPTDAFEFIGVAEPSADVPVAQTMPLHKNRKGKGWFWGGDANEAFVYTFMELKPGMNDRKMAGRQLPAISPRSSSSSPRKEVKGEIQLPALRDFSMASTTKRMRALAEKQAELKRQIQEARSCETPPPELRIRPDPPSWSKGSGKGGAIYAPREASGPWWLPDHTQRAKAAEAARAEPEKRGIPGFRARHQKMKAEWSEKWNSAKEEEWGEEDWGEEGWDEDGWDEGGDWEEAW